MDEEIECFIDDTIDISQDDLPKLLREDVEDLQKFKDEGDWIRFDACLEGFETSIKSFLSVGRISKSLVKKLFDKYNI